MKRLTLAVALLCLIACAKKETSAPAAATDTAASTSSSAVPAPAAAPSAAASSVKACDLFTPDDLKRITGIEFVPGKSTGDQASVSQCGWSQKTGSEGGVSATLYDKDVVDTYAAMPGHSSLSGVGDKGTQATDGSVVVTKNGRSVAIDFNFPGAKLEWGAELAKIAVSKM